MSGRRRRTYFRGGVTLALCGMVSGALAGEPRLFGRWTFDEVKDGMVSDLSSGGHPGRVHGKPAKVPGISGGALRFQSNDDYVDFGAPVIPARDFTISIWVNCDDVAKQFFLGQYSHGHPRRLDLAVREGSVRIQIKELLDSPKLVEPGTWHHLAYTRRGEDVTSYLDGKPVMRGRLPVDVLQTENTVVGKIFVPNQDSFRFTGSLDELAIWDAALAEDEIRAIYERVRAAGSKGSK